MCMLEMYMQGNYVKQMMDICLVMTVIILNLMVLVRYRLQCRFTLPLSEKEYKSKTLFPFFDGLIPEGWMLQVVSRNWKINIQDRFGLLIVSCKDCIGNVSIKEVKE